MLRDKCGNVLLVPGSRNPRIDQRHAGIDKIRRVPRHNGETVLDRGAAIMASRSERGSGMCSDAHTGAVLSVKGKIRPANAARTPVNQLRSALP